MNLVMYVDTLLYLCAFLFACLHGNEFLFVGWVRCRIADAINVVTLRR